jgi:hypothetical protein
VRKTLSVLLLLSTCSTGCGIFGPSPAALREILYVKQKLGTPAFVVAEPGKAQVVTALVPDQEGRLVPGKLDSAGMMLIDEPTYQIYREAFQRQQGEQEKAPGPPAGPQTRAGM